MNTLQIILVISGYLSIGVIVAVLFFLNEMKNGDFEHEQQFHRSRAILIVLFWPCIYTIAVILFIGDYLAKVVIAIANTLYRRLILTNRQHKRR